jgi:hypothetical protein
MYRVDTEIGNFEIGRDAGGDRSSPPGAGSRKFQTRMTIFGVMEGIYLMDAWTLPHGRNQRRKFRESQQFTAAVCATVA